MKWIFSLLSVFAFVSAETLLADSWPAWRGDLAGSGKTSETKLPTEWSQEKNIKWKIDLPDRGNSTPVIFGDKIFLTQAIDEENWRGLMCLDKNDGKLLWKKGVTYKEDERTHKSNPYCSASPATDGEMVVVSYGSAGLAAYDFDGKELWKKELGAIDHVWGNSSSPLLYDNLVIHYHGPGPGAYLIAVEKDSGNTKWKWEEPEWDVGTRTDGFRGRERGVVGSFSTPITYKAGDYTELVMSFPMEMKAFAPHSGKELWTCEGLNPLVYSSPMQADGVVFATGGYQGNSIGVKVGGSGDVTKENRLWYLNRHNGGIGTGVVKDGLYFYHDSGGGVFCLDTKTGKTLWDDKLPGSGRSWGSFVLAGDLIYTLSQGGETVVFKANPEKLEVVSQNDLDEYTNSSPAISDGEIFIRTWETLWCVSEK